MNSYIKAGFKMDSCQNSIDNIIIHCLIEGIPDVF